MTQSTDDAEPRVHVVEKVLQEESVLDRVCVYTDRAEVKRIIRLSCDHVGRVDVKLTQASKHIMNADTISVKGKGKFMILGVSYSTGTPLQKNEDEDEDLTTAEKLDKEIGKIEKELQKLHHDLKCQRNARGSITEFMKTVSKNPKAKTTDTMESMEEFAKAAADFDEKIRILEESIAKLTKNRNELQEKKMNLSKPCMTVSLDCNDDQENEDIVLAVTYYVSRASWQPCYDVRVDSETGKSQIEYKATITQSTDEDWNDCQVSLATATPHEGGSAPTLPVMHIQPGAQHHHRKKKMKNARFGSVDMTVNDASQDTTRGNFIIQEKSTIKSDNNPHKVSIGTIDLVSKFRHYIVPAQNEHAFIQMESINNSDMPLLPSDQVQIYLNGDFVGKTVMPSVASGKLPFRMFVGADAGVEVNYRQNPSRKATNRGFVSSSTIVTRSSNCVVKNLTDRETVAVVIMPLPRSNEDSVKIRVVEPSPESIISSDDVHDDQDSGDEESTDIERSSSSISKKSRGHKPVSDPKDEYHGGGFEDGDKNTQDNVIRNTFTNNLIFTRVLQPKTETTIKLVYEIEHSKGQQVYENTQGGDFTPIF